MIIIHIWILLNFINKNMNIMSNDPSLFDDNGDEYYTLEDIEGGYDVENEEEGIYEYYEIL